MTTEEIVYLTQGEDGYYLNMISKDEPSFVRTPISFGNIVRLAEEAASFVGRGYRQANLGAGWKA